MDAVWQTWGAHCDELVFTSPKPRTRPFPPAFPHTDEDEDDDDRPHPTAKTPLVKVLNLTVSDDAADAPNSKSLWHVMSPAWAYLGLRHTSTSDWIVKVDDDTFFIPENLAFALSKRPALAHPQHNHHYVGHVLDRTHRRRNEGRFVAGPACAVSAHTLRALVPFLPARARTSVPELPDPPPGCTRCPEPLTHADDVVFGQCLRHAAACVNATGNINAADMGVPTHLRDAHNRELVLLLQPDHNLRLSPHAKRRSEAWYWEGKSPPLQYGAQCCGAHPISFHYLKTTRSIDQARMFFGVEYLMYHVRVLVT